MGTSYSSLYFSITGLYWPLLQKNFLTRGSILQENVSGNHACILEENSAPEHAF